MQVKVGQKYTKILRLYSGAMKIWGGAENYKVVLKNEKVVLFHSKIEQGEPWFKIIYFVMGIWDPRAMILMGPRALEKGPIIDVSIHWKFYGDAGSL